MKKTKKKLVLTRETLRILGLAPRQVVGAEASDGCTNSTNGCPYTFGLTCGQTDACPASGASCQKCRPGPL